MPFQGSAFSRESRLSFVRDAVLFLSLFEACARALLAGENDD